jgi:hypothetical protein
MVQALQDFRFESVHEFTPDALPLRYWDGANPAGATLGETGDAPVETAVDHDWWVHSSDTGTMLHAFVIPDQWRSWGVVRGTVLRDADAATDGGAAPAAGYSLLNMKNLREAGTYDLMMASIVLPAAYEPGDEAEPMASLRTPLRTRVGVPTCWSRG